MRLVLDASIVLPLVFLLLVAFATDEAMELRAWTERALDGDQAHVIDILTPLEVVSALQRLEALGEIEPDWATVVQRRSFGGRSFGWPFVRVAVRSGAADPTSDRGDLGATENLLGV